MPKFFFTLLFAFFITTNAQDFTLDPAGNTTGSNPLLTDFAEVEIHYDGDNIDAVGAANANFIIAARFTPTQLGAYVGMGFVKLRVYISFATVGNTGTVKVYSAGSSTQPGPEIYSQNVTTVPNSWNEYIISPYIIVPNADVWFGLQATAGPVGSQFWGGVDAGPNHPDGQWIYFNNAWAKLVSLNSELTFNWNIRAVVDTEVPVELTAFTANANFGVVELQWITATETNNQGFEVQRSYDGEFITIAFVEGHGTTTEVQNYSFIDRTVNTGSVSYRLRQVDFDGSFEYSDVVEIDVPAPAVFALDQNYPNPFNPSTKITFSLAVDSKINLTVFNVLGQEVANLVNANLGVGAHSVDFDASALNSGVYMYRIEASGIDGTNFVDVKKMILTK